jgi:long-chain acyl-CoA synthetase
LRSSQETGPAAGLGVRGRDIPPTDQFWPSVTDYLLEAGLSEDVAVTDAHRAFSYRDLRRAAAGLASELDAKGIEPGARVGILASNSFFWVAAYLASLRKHVAVPLSDKLSASEMADQARRVACAAVLVDQTLYRRFASAFDGGTVFVTDATLGSSEEFTWPSAPTRDIDADALLLFTSGTTGASKAVRITQRNIVANTESIVSYLGLQRDDRMLVVLPFYYCFGLSLLHTHLRVGGSVVLCNSFVFPELAIDMLEEQHCTGLAGVPSSFHMLLRASSFGHRELPDLRHIQQAGGKLSPALVDELVMAKPAAKLFVMYGQTEATARLSYLPPDLVRVKSGSIGKGIPGVELRVVDGSGKPVKPGLTGEIVARGDNISAGYMDAPEESAAKFPGGELRTGDLATVDEDGFIYVVDRKADFIKSWGHRISSHEIEGCVMQMRDIVSAAAVGIPDPDAGEAIALVVTLCPDSSLNAEDIVAFARTQLVKHKVPKQVHVVGAMPLNANGKIDKNRVRDLIRALATPS